LKLADFLVLSATVLEQSHLKLPQNFHLLRGKLKGCTENVVMAWERVLVDHVAKDEAEQEFKFFPFPHDLNPPSTVAALSEVFVSHTVSDINMCVMGLAAVNLAENPVHGALVGEGSVLPSPATSRNGDNSIAGCG
jgi:hypothetical protein